MPTVATTQEELEMLAQRMTASLRDGSTQALLDKRIAGKGMLYSPQLLQEVEAVQRDLFAEWGFEPQASLSNLQGAVRKYPGIRPAIAGLCDAEETLLMQKQTALAKEHNIELPTPQEQQQQQQQHGGHSHGGHGHGGHGHSHGGHGHSHGGHGHSHGGHGHGGHGHGNMMEQMPPGAIMQQQIAMQLVQKSFTADQLGFMQQLRAKIMSGQPPTGEEQMRAMQVQQAMQKKMMNMGPMVQSAWETLEEEERAAVLAVEVKLREGRQADVTEDDTKAVEAAKDSIATYIATMGPMLMAMRQQQMAAAAAAGGAAPAAGGSQPSASAATESTPADAASAGGDAGGDKKKD